MFKTKIMKFFGIQPKYGPYYMDYFEKIMSHGK